MGRGRKKGTKPPLSNAERQRKYRAKQNETNIEGYKEKRKKENRRQYEKRNNDPLRILQHQMDGVQSYYKKNPLIKVINAKKGEGISWGVELFLDHSDNKESVTIEPSKTEVCKLPMLKHKYNILWICSNTEKEAVKGPNGYLKTHQMLLGDEIRMVIAAAKPDKEILSSIRFSLARANSNINWNIGIDYDSTNNQVFFKKGSKSDNLIWKSDEDRSKWVNLEGSHDIVAINVGKKMWYPDYGTVQDFSDAKQILKSNNEVIVYANPSTGNTEGVDISQVYDSAWLDVDEDLYENYETIEYVPLHGSDKSNIPEKYTRLIRPCYCFKIQKEITNQARYEVVAIHKELNYNCQIEAKYEDYKGLSIKLNHDEVELAVDMGLTKHIAKDEKAIKSARTRKVPSYYCPTEEDAKMKAFKAASKKVQQDNKATKERIRNSRIVCNSQMKSNTRFGRFMDIFRHCTVTKKESSTVSSNIWKDLNDHDQLFNVFLRSEFPTAYVDITYDFLLNSIPMGIFKLNFNDTQTLKSAWAPVMKATETKIRVVSVFNKTFFNLNVNTSQC